MPWIHNVSPLHAHVWSTSALLCWLLLPAVGRAQGAVEPSVAMVVDPPPETSDPRSERLDVGVTWGAQIGVPISLDVNRDVVRPGFDVSIPIAADFGYFAIGGTPGIGWIPIRLEGLVVDGNTLSGRSPITRIFISIPEFRVQVPNLKVVLPYLSGAFDINFWNFRDAATGCGFFSCDSDSGFQFTPGFTGRAGLGFELSEEIYLDIGFRYSLSGKGHFFDRVRWWLTPYAGVLFRM